MSPLLSTDAREQLALIVSGRNGWYGLVLPPPWVELRGHGLITVSQGAGELSAAATPLGLRSCALALQSGLLRELDAPLDDLYSKLEVATPRQLRAGPDLGGYMPQHLPPGKLTGS